MRKPRKLPAECASISYDLEYGQDTLQIHRDAVGNGQRVIIADDLLATGGTAKATADLVESLGGRSWGWRLLSTRVSSRASKATGLRRPITHQISIVSLASH